MLGWSAFSRLASAPADDLSYVGEAGTLQPTLVSPEDTDETPPLLKTKVLSAEAILRWATACLADQRVGRAQLERWLLGFQQNFLGGEGRRLELLTTGGGTRSINLAFEAVLASRAAEPPSELRVLTGNPHLAVERAARRFGFQLTRLDVDGSLCPRRLAEAIHDPAVVAVYAQSLSYTDGTCDDLMRILEIIELENCRRVQAMPAREAARVPLIHLINDSCLAFCALVHNDGTSASERRGGRRGGLRVLDMCVLDMCAQPRGTCGVSGPAFGDSAHPQLTPLLVTLDAHKHLGTDKGVSSVLGTPGTLERLRGRQKVGAQPSKGVLIRALADMYLVGVEGYRALYGQLAERLERAAADLASAGLTIVNAHNRPKGSTVLACEDPDAVMTKRLKKRGHAFAHLFHLHPSGLPEGEGRSQLGWSLSFTPYSLREVAPGRMALDVFLNDLAVVCEHRRGGRRPWLVRLLSAPDSLLSVLLSGGVPEPCIFTWLWTPGWGRWVSTTIMRRLYGQILDAGVIASSRRADSLATLARLISLVFIVVFLLFVLLALLLGRLDLSLEVAAQPHALVLALPALGAFLSFLLALRQPLSRSRTTGALTDAPSRPSAITNAKGISRDAVGATTASRAPAKARSRSVLHG